MSCDGSTGAVLNSTDCACPIGYYLVEKDTTGAYRVNGKICVRCQTTSYVPLDNKYACLVCGPNMAQSASTGLCVCNSGFDQVRKGCEIALNVGG